MTSANFASPSNQIDWLTTNSSLSRLVHPHVAVGVVHGAEDRAAVLVEHVHRRMAGRRIHELAELVLDRLADPAVALRLAVGDRLRQPDARDLLAVGVHGRQLRHALVERDRHRGVLQVARHAAFGVAGEIEIEIDRRAPLQVAHVAAGLAEPLHRREAHHHARPLDAGLVAAGAAVAVAPAAGREIDALRAPTRAPARARPWPERRFLSPATRASSAMPSSSPVR